MKVLAKQFVDKFGEESVARIISIRWGRKRNMPAVAMYCNDQIIAIGRELEGYVGDIIRVMYTGEHKGEGDYILVSDRHGMICKFPEAEFDE